MVFGILVIILGILGIAVFGRDEVPAGVTAAGSLTSKESAAVLPQKPSPSLGGGDDAASEPRANAKDIGSKPFIPVGGSLDGMGAKSIDDLRFDESKVPTKKVDEEVAGTGNDKKDPVEPVAAPKDEAPKTYKVKKGDNFTKIAATVLGDKKYADDIAKANPTVNAAKLFENQVLVLPTIKKDAPKAKTEPATPKSITKDAKGSSTGLEATDDEKPKAGEAPKTHVVQAGEKLVKISKRYYGDDTSKVKAIQKLNPSVVNWNNLPAGTVLKLP